MARALFVVGLAWAALNAALVFFVYSGQRVHRMETGLLVFVVVAAIYLLSSAVPIAQQRRPTDGAAALLPIATVAGATWLVALVTQLSFPFLSDDYVFLEAIATNRWSWEFYRPLFAAVFATLGWLGSMSAWQFHVVAFALHVACAVMAGLLVSRLFDDHQAASLAGALVLLNPLQLEAVLWVSGLQELLWAFFALVAVTIYTARFELGPRRATLTAVAAAAAIASKETGACVVLLLVGADMVLGRRHQRLQYAVYVAAAACVAGYLWLRAGAGAGGPDESFPIRNGYQLKEFLVTPYRRFVFPWSAAVWVVPNAIAGLTSLTVISGVAWAIWRHRAGLLVTGAVVVIITTLPLQRYLYVSPSLEHARYLYLPAVGWSIIVAGVVTAAVRSRRGHLIASTVLIGVSGWALLANLHPWQEAGAFVRTLTEQVAKGVDPAAALSEWRQAHGWPAGSGADLPEGHDGVWLFQNGQGEFLRMARSGRLTAPRTGAIIWLPAPRLSRRGVSRRRD